MTTANDNEVDERITALVATYADAANWRVNCDSSLYFTSGGPTLKLPHLTIAFEGHTVVVSDVDADDPFDEHGWLWVITTGDGRGTRGSERALPTKARPRPAVRLIRSEGMPEAEAERANSRPRWTSCATRRRGFQALMRKDKPNDDGKRQRSAGARARAGQGSVRQPKR